MTEALPNGPSHEAQSSFRRIQAAVEDAGLNHKTRGFHIQVECPSHADQEPSLSIDWMKDGKTALKCQAGCSSDAVLAALGLTFPMLFDDYEHPEDFKARRAREREEARKSGRNRTTSAGKRTKTTSPARTMPALPKGRLPARLTKLKPKPLGSWSETATYDYCDVYGTVLHQEVRHQRPIEKVDPATGKSSTTTEKRFTQRWPTKGGWLDKAPTGFSPVLYRLPEVVDAIAEGRRIWLCEGAKDAERLIELGQIATTNPSGASNFKAHQAAALEGAHVVVVVDHDSAGYKRGARLFEMLSKAMSVRVVLPAVKGRHQDASDHLDAGHSLDDFVDVTPDEIHQLVQVATAEEAADAAVEAAAEAAARADRVSQVKASAADDETRWATRWAAEAAKHLGQAIRAGDDFAQIEAVQPTALTQRISTAITQAQDATRQAHQAAGIKISDDLKPLLTAPSFGATDSDQGEEPVGEVVDHPTSARLPDPTAAFPMSRGVWAYELGGEYRRPRGVYQLNENRWVKVAPLPALHARIVSRDGYGRPMGTYYLVSATPDSVKVTIGQDELAKNTWPNILGLAISHDDKILKAATTALIFAAEAETDVVEATPRVSEDGKITTAVPETLPHGYLATHPAIDRDSALRVWNDLVMRAAENPRMALALGASAFGPFLSALGRQPHIVSLYGEMAQGKSVTMRAAASIWGHPGSKTEAGVCESWNQSKLAPTTFLGELGVLPAFFDEIGMAGNLTSADWGKRIFDICEGASRGRPAANGRPGFVRGRSWYGILVSAGNSRLMDGIGAGGMAGTQRRVVELAAPFTNSAEHSEAIENLYPLAYGHLGAEILEQHSAETVAHYIDAAAEQLNTIETQSPVAQEILKHLVSHIAGAAIIDELVGSGGLLAAAAFDGAVDYLSEWEEPLHDADRILDAIHDSLGQEPACWPSVAAHLENTTAGLNYDSQHDSEIARHGVALKTRGLIANDDAWIAVFPSVWRDMCEELGVDSDVACRELTNRGILLRQNSSHKPGARNHTSLVKVGRTAKRFYKLAFPEMLLDEDEGTLPHEADPTPTPNNPPTNKADKTGEPDAVTAPVTASGAEVTAEVTAATPPLTCEVTAVTAVTAPPSRIRAREGDSNSEQPTDPAANSTETITKLDQPDTCVGCGELTGWAINQVPAHPGGECAFEATGATHTQPPTAHEGEPAGTAPREPRFASPVAVVSTEAIYLPGGHTVPWPETVEDLSDLAQLATRDQLRLGHGGGELPPEPGLLVLTSQDVLDRVGIPAIELGDQEGMDAKAALKAKREKLAPVAELPTVTAAEAKGWEIANIDAWLRLSHPQLLPGGVTLVMVPWINDTLRDIPLFTGAADETQLADNLADFANVAGVQFHLHAAVTAHRLIYNTRPMRTEAREVSGNNPNRAALKQHTQSELPDFYRAPRDGRFAGQEGFSSVEGDYAWWRPFTSLHSDEQAAQYVHSYDRKASYLAEWNSVELGMEGLIHTTGTDAHWDGSERPGIFLIARTWGDWPHLMPEPRWSAVVSLESHGQAEGTGVWVTTMTLKALAKVGITPEVIESYTWATHSRYLALAAQRLFTARKHPNPAVVATTKQIYARGTGRLARTDGTWSHDALWRPDWYDTIRASARFKILHTVAKIAESSGNYPLAVGRDSILYASDERDPIKAWPGDRSRLGDNPGLWAPEASGLLAEWGPLHLPDKHPGAVGGWASVRAMEALTNHKNGREQW